MLEAEQRNHCMIFQTPVIVVNIGMCKGQITSRAAANKRNRILACFVHSLQNKSLAAGSPIHINHGKAMCYTKAEWNLMLFNFPANSRHPVIDAHLYNAPAQVAIGERYAHNICVLNHPIGIHLQQQLGTSLRIIAVEGTASLCPAKLPGGCQQNNLR